MEDVSMQSSSEQSISSIIPKCPPDTVLVPLSRMRPPSHDIRPERTPEQIQEKRESIRQHGILTPLKGFWCPDQYFELLDGFTRYQALLLEGWKEAPVNDLGHVPTALEALEIQVNCNEAHA